MKIGSLFSGIGGLELGLEWAGVGHTVWQVESDAYCRGVLEQHWPNAQRFPDVRDVGARNLATVDVICGGFPCQDIAYCGLNAGLSGARSGLWWEFARIIGEMGPEFVVVENVAALLTRGLGEVLGTLTDLGYDAEWSTLSACAVGAPHVRRRLFVLAYANRFDGWQGLRDLQERAGRTLPPRDHAPCSRADWSARMANPSALYRGADGLPFGMERNRAIGNAVVPQCAEIVGRRLMEIAAGLQERAA